MKTRFKLFISIFMLFTVMACAVGQAATPTLVPTPVPTDTPAPTATPVPTDTPVPTSTATPLPTATKTATPVPTATSTATPDIKATLAMQSTKTAEALTADFLAKMKKLGITADKARLGWVQQAPMGLELTTAADAYYKKFAEDVSASDFILKTDVTWTATNYIFCGFYFRSDLSYAKGKHYEFEFTNFPGLPGWRITFWDNSILTKKVTDRWRWASALKQENDTTNQFILVAEAEKFTVFINDQRIGSFFDGNKSATEGYFAIQAWQDSGKGTCTFENTQIWHLK